MNNRSFSPVDVQEEIDLLFVFSDFPPHTRVRTPYCHPDGTIVDVYHTEETHRLSDLGTTVHYLSSLDIKPAHVNLETLRADINVLYGVQYDRGVFYLLVTDVPSIARGIIKLSQSLLLYVAVLTSASTMEWGATVRAGEQANESPADRGARESKDKTSEQQIIESLHYRLQRHHYTCTREEVELGLNMLALKNGESKQNTALYLYWLLREGGHEQIPEIFIQQVSKRTSSD